MCIRDRESVYLSRLCGDELLLVACAEPNEGFQVCAEAGSSVPLHCTTQGKAILAFMPELEQRRVPVSYTHLDVYKRQPFTRIFATKMAPWPPTPTSRTLFVWFISVLLSGNRAHRANLCADGAADAEGGINMGLLALHHQRRAADL